MKEASRPGPAAAASRVKEGVKDLARGAVGAAGDVALELGDAYRKSTRYFRMRAAVVVAWALLSAVTLWGACPSSGPANSLGAKVALLSRNEPGVLTGTQLLVENDSPRIWRDVVLTLEGGWRHERKTIRPQDRVVLAIAQFTKDGERAPPELEPKAITIECDEGRVTAPLVPR